MADLIKTQEQAINFVNHSSQNGILALYAFSLSLDTTTSFDRNDLIINTNISSADYFWGFIVACYAANIISFNLKNKVVTPTYMNKLIIDEIKKILLTESSNSVLKDKIKKIDNYFNSRP